MAASFGERLKKEREKRGMTLEEVSGVTKISVRNLRALETEKFDQMPGGIFNRGFVRSYAKHLGLDDEQVIADYLEASGESAPFHGGPEGAIEVSVQAGEPIGPPMQVPWAALAGLIVFGALLLASWVYYSRHQDRQAGVRQSAAETQTVPDSAAARAGVVPTVPPQTPSVTAAGGTTLGPEAVANRGFDIAILASDEVWVSAAVDDQPAAESTLVKRQSLTIHASDKVVLRLGNAAAVAVSFNGQPVPVTGSDGEVRNLTFTSGGLQSKDPAIAKPN